MKPEEPFEAADRLRPFILYISIVLTLLMLLFPPYSSLNGVEHAFILSGPAWVRGLEHIAEPLGLSARIDWPSLAGQLIGLWAISLGALWFSGRRETPTLPLTPSLILLLIPLASFCL